MLYYYTLNYQFTMSIQTHSYLPSEYTFSLTKTYHHQHRAINRPRNFQHRPSLQGFYRTFAITIVTANLDIKEKSHSFTRKAKGLRPLTIRFLRYP